MPDNKDVQIFCLHIERQKLLVYVVTIVCVVM